MQTVSDSTGIDPRAIEALLPTKSQIKQMSVDDLRVALRVSHGITVVILAKAAEVWRELVDRGVDMNPYLEEPLYQRVRDIAGGKLIPELVMKFGTNTRTLNRLGTLPPVEQKKMVDDPHVLVVEKNPATGALDERKLSVEHLQRSQLDLVIAPEGRVRTPAEQRAILSAPLSVPASLPQPESSSKGRIIIARGKLYTIGEVTVSKAIEELRDKGYLPPASGVPSPNASS